jgi:hypothetical protein
VEHRSGDRARRPQLCRLRDQRGDQGHVHDGTRTGPGRVARPTVAPPDPGGRDRMPRGDHAADRAAADVRLRRRGHLRVPGRDRRPAGRADLPHREHRGEPRVPHRVPRRVQARAASVHPGGRQSVPLPSASCGRDGPPPSRPCEGPSHRTSTSSWSRTRRPLRRSRGCRRRTARTGPPRPWR